MIRIDEIYDNVMWQWINQQHPGVRVQFCDPFGRSDPDSILNYGREDIPEYNYTFFFDQEPIQLDLHTATFERIVNHHNKDLYYNQQFQNNQRPLGLFITSECDSENVEKICEIYNWKSYYYFFHGWAALDWYRGYNRTFLMTPPEQRTITRTFIMPNRIVAGKRQHRLLMLYHIFRNQLTNNWISCPNICPAENIRTVDAVQNLAKIYPDISSVFAQQNLPINFPGESDHPMTSCWLTNFKESADCLLYLITETVASGRRHHLTEKTFKPICLGMPFVMVSTAGSLDYLRRYGFKTFDTIWDESYDDERDDIVRLEKIAQLLTQLDQQSLEQKQRMFRQALPIIRYNLDHFYNGGFEQILWQELTAMLGSLDV